MRTLSRVTRILISSSAIGVIAASIGVLIWFLIEDEHAERRTIGRQPELFYDPLASDQLDDYSRVFGIAHNSGDSFAATRRALIHGADVIEVDVIMHNGELYAAHDPPVGVIGRRAFRGPRLVDIWQVANDAEVVALDLKQSSADFLTLTIAFLQEREDYQVIVSTDDPQSLWRLADEAPHAFRFYSISTQGRLDAMRDDPDLVQLIDGVGIRENLVTDESAAWMHDEGLMILAWTVNDLQRVNELVDLGVTAITTDNLAILELLGGQMREDTMLTRAIMRRDLAAP